MIIWGSKAKEHFVGDSVFFCPNCRLDSGCRHIRISRYFTLYFIPLFPMAMLAEFVRCNNCQSNFKPDIIRLSREQILDILEPWVCPRCQNHNPTTERSCLACGTVRPIAGPPQLPPPMPGALPAPEA